MRKSSNNQEDHKAMARTMMRLCVLALTLYGLLGISASQEVLVVGGNLGWTIPAGGPAVYQAWALLQTFDVGDILRESLSFNFLNLRLFFLDSYVLCAGLDARGY